ncbi:MAG: cell division topological specificity factor MinE [Burkholderiales bacterium]|nr:cell division topological specificity factor MinE [Burkholderiales bacterium]
MSLINSFIDYLRGSKPKSATVAKERLQLILAHGGGRRGIPEYLPALRHDLIAVIAKYVPIDPEQIKMDFNRQGDYDLLELNIVLPESSRRVQRPAR